MSRSDGLSRWPIAGPGIKLKQTYDGRHKSTMFGCVSIISNKNIFQCCYSLDSLHILNAILTVCLIAFNHSFVFDFLFSNAISFLFLVFLAVQQSTLFSVVSSINVVIPFTSLDFVTIITDHHPVISCYQEETTNLKTADKLTIKVSSLLFRAEEQNRVIQRRFRCRRQIPCFKKLQRTTITEPEIDWLLARSQTRAK